jgi:hypothetical protein
MPCGTIAATSVFRIPLLAARSGTLLFAIVVAAYVWLTASGLLTFPRFYEDESWTYLAAFEGLRGNGFTWAAFGEGKPMVGLFSILVMPPLAMLSGIAPESALRIVAAGWGVAALSAAYACARRLAPSAAWVAPALMLATPSVFIATRYGRMDVVALALALWSLAAAAAGRPLLSGLGYGLSISVHPLFIWAAVPCLWLLNARVPGQAIRFVCAAAAGVAPQALWILANFADVQAIVRRHAVSSSIAADASGGIGRSVLAEPQRYLDYIIALPSLQQAAEFFAYILLRGGTPSRVGNRRCGAVDSWRTGSGAAFPEQESLLPVLHPALRGCSFGVCG